MSWRIAPRNGDMESEPHSRTADIVSGLLTTPDAAVRWLDQMLPLIMRRLMDSENLDMPLLQLPLAQLRLAQALYKETGVPGHVQTSRDEIGDTMGQLSERLGVRHNALTQAADRLINHDLAERASDPRDRRIVRLRLTAKGRTWVQARRERRLAHLDTLWTRLNADERFEFLRAVRILEAAGRRMEAAGSETEPADDNATLRTVEETLARFVAGTDTSASELEAPDRTHQS